MSITANTGLVPEWFTPTSQEGEDNPARFKVKPLDSKEMVEVQAFHTAEKGIGAQGLYHAFEISIIEWENVNDGQGKALKCTRTNVKAIPIDVIAEAGAHAISISFLSDDEIKNS
jgi:hypothetical protein